MSRSTRSACVALAAALTVGMAACSTNSSGTSAASGGGGGNAASATGSAATAVNAASTSLTGDISFNDTKLAQLRDKLKAAMKGKSLQGVDPAVVVNVTAAYWDAAKQGVKNANKELGINAKFQEPTTMDINQQLSIVNTLLSQNSTGFAISAIQPSSSSFISSAQGKKVPVIAIDSPLNTYKSVPLYLGTPNYDAGHKAGEAMKALLPNGGDVAILVGSL